MESSQVAIERRRYRRYQIPGQVLFRTEGAVEGEGKLLNIGIGGLLLRTEVLPPEGTHLWVHFAVDDGLGAFITHGRIVWAQQDALAILFLEEPARLQGLLQFFQFSSGKAAS